MKIRSYRILFRIFSHLADKTNGASFFVKYKLLLGTLIIGLAGTSCGKSKMQHPTCYDISPPEPEIPQIMCYEPVAPPLPEKDTIKVIPSVPPKDIVIEEIPMITCYEPTVPDVIPVDEKRPEPDFMLYGSTETPPVSHVGDIAKFRDWMEKNIEYSPEMIEQEIKGRLVVNFIIDTAGKIVEPKIMRSLTPETDEEALRILSTAPDWRPGIHNQEPVRVSVTLHIAFTVPEK